LYTQNAGLAMGVPFSDLLSEIFLRSFKSEGITKLSSHLNILDHFRYVDIFVICDSVKSDINLLFTDFNQT
jgi:hypothetical protein